ncbi:hypothetical protein M436DRAFT_82695 [Aureobasidium namibiae CBS 147.97]|uniref:Uncharacterized protein n=1 Tax=Aureobasidium namibiae CBS 147.97 TaxID=1043004 RepID=A0A074WLX1_9PEZI
MSSPVKFSFAYSEMPLSSSSPTEMSMPSPAEWMSPSSKKSAASIMSSPASKMSFVTPKKTSFAADMSSPTSEMSPAPLKFTPKKSSPATESVRTRANSIDSKCTTFSDIIKALDETHGRIASMGVDDIKQDRIDSMHSLSDADKSKMTYHRAFDTKKYMKDYENGDITLRQIQLAANAIKLPEEHRADWIAVNGKFPEPACGYGKCTYDPYPGPTKRRRDTISDNIEEAVKKVKNAFSK